MIPSPTRLPAERFPTPPPLRLRDIARALLLSLLGMAAVSIVGLLLLRIVVHIVLTLAGLR